jgi:hypothetical protein
MELISAERINTHGGSLRGVAQLKSGPHTKQASVEKLIAHEASLDLNQAETFEAFGRHIDEIKTNLTNQLKSLKAQGKTIAGFGAPAKATTLMYHFGIGPNIIDFIVDDSPLKQNLYAPGLHIPILPSQAIYDKKPDAVVILAWNFAESIMENHAQYLEQGGQFIVPLPEVKSFG